MKFGESRKAHCSSQLICQALLFLTPTRYHFKPLVFGHSWLEMAPREGQKPFHFLNTSDCKQILMFTSTGLLRQFNGFYFTLGAISSLEMAPRER